VLSLLARGAKRAPYFFIAVAGPTGQKKFVEGKVSSGDAWVPSAVEIHKFHGIADFRRITGPLFFGCRIAEEQNMHFHHWLILDQSAKILRKAHAAQMIHARSFTSGYSRILFTVGFCEAPRSGQGEFVRFAGTEDGRQG
jgi:hypothetical protein